MYATAQDILERAGSADLAELAVSTGAPVDLAHVEALAREASAEVDTYLADRYELPFEEPVPATLKPAVIDLALERLFGADGPSFYRLKATATRTFLRQVQLGVHKIVGRTYRRKDR